MDFSSLVNEIIYVLVVAILPILTKYIVDALKSYAEAKAIEANNNEQFQIADMISNAEETVTTIVIALNQTVVETAKQNGTWNEITAEEVKQAAIDTATRMIADSSKLAISSIYNSFSQWLNVQIEKTVNENK